MKSNREVLIDADILWLWRSYETERETCRDEQIRDSAREGDAR